MSMTTKPMPITVQEEKEIHQAFERLCDYPLKVRLHQEKVDIDAWIEADKGKSHQYGYVEPVAFVKKSLLRKEEIGFELEALKTKPDMKVCSTDVREMFKFLNYKTTIKEIDEMIWEVDENLDGCLDWGEFRLMFNRNVTDQSGLEPNRMVRCMYAVCLYGGWWVVGGVCCMLYVVCICALCILCHMS
jgi:hypothetical protein